MAKVARKSAAQARFLPSVGELILALSSILLVTSCGQLPTTKPANPAPTAVDATPAPEILEEAKTPPRTGTTKFAIRDYEAVLCDCDSPYFTLSRHGHVFYKLGGGEQDRISLLYPDEKEPVGTAVAERGHAGLKDKHAQCVVIEIAKPGGDFEYVILSVRKKVKVIGHAAPSQGKLGLTKDKKDPSKLEISISDTLPNWGIEAVAPRVTLEWNGVKLRAIRQSLPDSGEDLKNIKARFNDRHPSTKSVIDSAPPELAELVLQCYYSGHARAGRKVFDSAWPSDRPGKAKYWKSLMHAAQNGEHWKDVEALNARP